ncbi:MAG: hypothetical protein AAF721_40475 [Myxococcota bacterium]
MRNVLRLTVLTGLLSSPACDLASDDDGAASGADTGGADGGTEADDGGEGAGTSDDGAADDGADETGDGPAPDTGTDDSGSNPSGLFDYVGPSSDPAPDAEEAGSYECDGCPQAMIDTSDLSIDDASTLELTGTAAGFEGHGRFYIENSQGQFAGGMLPTNEADGTFEQIVPLFCGETTIKMLFGNESGQSVYVRKVNRGNCVPAEVRATLAWDDTSEEWQLHLLRFGGTMQGDETDCFDDFDCNGIALDWGAPTVQQDNPIMDVDEWLAYAGVEDIYVASGAEDGMTVVVDNIDVDGGPIPAGIVYINVGNEPTRVLDIDVLAPYEMFVAASVDGAAGTSTSIGTTHACAKEWSDGCIADLP